MEIPRVSASAITLQFFWSRPGKESSPAKKKHNTHLDLQTTNNLKDDGEHMELYLSVQNQGLNCNHWNLFAFRFSLTFSSGCVPSPKLPRKTINEKRIGTHLEGYR